MTSILRDIKAYLLGDSSTPSNKVLEDKYNKFLKCLKYEQSLRPISITTIPTITWFRGDKTKAAQFLKKRMQKIVELNPWVAGSIVDRNRIAHLAYQDGPDFNAAKAMETMFFDDEPELQTGLESRLTEVSNEILETPWYIVRSRASEPVWRTIVLGTKTDENVFAVVFSMAHMAVDGESFYRIYKMFIDPDIPIEALDPRRDVDVNKIRKDIFGGTHMGLENNLASAWHFVLFKLFYTPNWVRRSYMIDFDKINEMKKRHDPEKEGVPFVSTNDIVSSWFFANSGAPFGRMTINLRFRVPDEILNNQMSANYQGTIFLQSPKETISPSSIRKVIRNLKRPDEDFPTGRQALFGGKHTLFSNWMSLSGLDKLQPPGCTEVKHTPLDVSNAALPSGGLGIFYRYAQGKAVMGMVGAGKAEDCKLLTAPEFGSILEV